MDSLTELSNDSRPCFSPNHSLQLQINRHLTQGGIPHLCFPAPERLFFFCCFAFFTHVFLHFVHAFTCLIRELFLRRCCVFAYRGLGAWVVALSSRMRLSGLSLQSFFNALFTCTLRHSYFTTILRLHTLFFYQRFINT